MNNKFDFAEPIFIEVNDMAESVFAGTSGIVPGTPEYFSDCWTIKTSKDQANAGQGQYGAYCTHRLQCDHDNCVSHISAATLIMITTSQPVAHAEFEGFQCKADGTNVIYLIRENHANGYCSGDNYNSLLKLWPVEGQSCESIEVTSASILCAKRVNVQGGYDGTEEELNRYFQLP